MAIKLAVFDIAGTTVADDKAVWIAFSTAFKAKGFSITEEMVNPLMGYHKPLAIKMILEKIGADQSDTLISELHETFTENMKEYYEYSPEVRAMNGAEEAMFELKQNGIRISLNTGFSREIADTIIERMQWSDMGLVDDYIASDEVTLGRPDAAMINKLMQRAGITDPQEVIKIGDTEVDINEGKNAGCLMVVAVTTGAFSRSQLEPYNPDYIIDNLSELPAIIRKYE